MTNCNSISCIQENFDYARGEAEKPGTSIDSSGRYWYAFNGLTAKAADKQIHIKSGKNDGGFGVDTNKGKNGKTFDARKYNFFEFDLNKVKKGTNSKGRIDLGLINGRQVTTTNFTVKAGRIKVELPPKARGVIDKMQIVFEKSVDLHLDNISFTSKAGEPIMQITPLPMAKKTAGRYMRPLANLAGYFISKNGNPPNAVKIFKTPNGPAMALYHMRKNNPSHLNNGGATTSEAQVWFDNCTTLLAAVKHNKKPMEWSYRYLKMFMMPNDGLESKKLPDSKFSGPNLIHWMVDISGNGRPGEKANGVFGENTTYNQYDPKHGLNNKPYACIAGQKGSNKLDASDAGQAFLFNSAPDAEARLIRSLYFRQRYGFGDQSEEITRLRSGLNLGIDPKDSLQVFRISWGRSAGKSGGPWQDVDKYKYSGYQDPAAWLIMGKKDAAQAIISFMLKAQKEYQKRHKIKGPFMPVYKEGIFGWTGPDPNTDWTGFQYRGFANAAFYYYLSGGKDKTAKQVAYNFYGWLAKNRKENNGKFIVPLSLHNKGSKIGQIKRMGYGPDSHALIAQGLLFMSAAENNPKYKKVAQEILDDLKTHAEKDGSYKYTDDPEPKARGTYGFHNAEVCSAYGLYELYPNF